MQIHITILSLTGTDLSLNNVKTRPNEAPYSVGLEYESVSTLSGSLSTSATDLILPGRNGLSFALTRSYDTGTAQYYEMNANYATNRSFEETRFPIGLGWTWNLSTIEIQNGKKYLHLAGKGTYEIGDSNELKGYPWQDLTFSSNSSVTVDGKTSAFKLSSINGISQYFTSTGLLIQITDNYNNYIHFKYMNQGTYGEVLSSIVDPLGNTINITYTITDVTITNGEQTVTYIKTIMNGKELLSQVWDPIGRATTYDYSLESATYNLSGSGSGGSNPYALLTGVTHPTGAKTIYNYESSPVTRQISDVGTNQAYRVAERKDQIFFSNGSVQDKNKKTFTYTGDMGSSYADDITFGTTINTILKNEISGTESIVSSTTFDNKKDYIDNDTAPVYYNTKVTTTADNQKWESTYTYDEARRWPWNPIQTIITTTDMSVTGSPSISTTVYSTYNDYGNVTSETNAMSIQTTYGYDSTSHLLMNITQLISSTQTRYTEYTRNTQGSIVGVKVREANATGSILQQIDYTNLDSYGNIQTITVENGSKDLISNTQYSSSYFGAFPTTQSVDVSKIDPVTGATLPSETITVSADYKLSTGQMMAFTDGESNTTQFFYDGLGRVTRTIHPDSSTVEVYYNDYHNILKVKDETGVVTVTKYNPVGWTLEEGIEERGIYKAKTKSWL